MKNGRRTVKNDHGIDHENVLKAPRPHFFFFFLLLLTNFTQNLSYSEAGPFSSAPSHLFIGNEGLRLKDEVTNSSVCPSVALTLANWLPLGFWFWHDRTFFLKEGVWFDPMFAKMKNSADQYFNTLSWRKHDECMIECLCYAWQKHLFTNTRARKIISSYPQCIEHRGSFIVITMVPHACILKGYTDLPTSRDKMRRLKKSTLLRLK